MLPATQPQRLLPACLRRPLTAIPQEFIQASPSSSVSRRFTRRFAPVSNRGWHIAARIFSHVAQDVRPAAHLSLISAMAFVGGFHVDAARE